MQARSRTSGSNWPRIITAASTLAIALAVIYAMLVQHSTVVCKGALGTLTVEGSKPSEPVGGTAGAARPDTHMTVWESICPENTKPISGSCVSQSGFQPLQNIGPAGNKWECAWGGPMPKADVQAVCLKTK
jgi:hypothetical protein